MQYSNPGRSTSALGHEGPICEARCKSAFPDFGRGGLDIVPHIATTSSRWGGKWQSALEGGNSFLGSAELLARAGAHNRETIIRALGRPSALHQIINWLIR